ncbi:MAG: DUF2605 domain-containing protein [Synechococcales cyanobacterium RU_4_20]|nr:DUF2605 domain-containing protein [Synechococcales cyanobacterium RU_4_20]NJR70597.1 DUF2605 domain-containing protein [Synechococcales cyanobacterium CRU_2_2]
MFNAPLPETKLLKTVLQPLLEDFQFWFGRTQTLLEAEQLDFIPAADQANLLERLRQTRQEVGVAQALLEATDGQAGVETSVIVPWHQLVLECWQLGMRFQQQRA